MTPLEALKIVDREDVESEYHQAVDVLRELVEGAPEVECPSCGATIRARMADAPQRGSAV